MVKFAPAEFARICGSVHIPVCVYVYICMCMYVYELCARVISSSNVAKRLLRNESFSRGRETHDFPRSMLRSKSLWDTLGILRLEDSNERVFANG